MKVFVSGCFDLLHSGHIAFFEEAAAYGQLYVGLGSDRTILELKHHQPICPELERLYMVRAIRFVHQAFINSGSGYLDFVPELTQLKPDIFFVNQDGDSAAKAELCNQLQIRYVVSQRKPKKHLPWRSSTALRESALFKIDTLVESKE